MYSSEISLIISFIALMSFSASYFFKKKSYYLILQGLGGLCLVFSYFFISAFFPMISLFIGLVRTATYYAYEKKSRSVPPYVVASICFATIINYVIVNIIILRTQRLVDIILVVSFCLYAIIFSIRKLEIVRYTVIIPHVLTIIYNILIHAPIFTAISYSVELAITIISICYFKFVANHNKK